MPGAVPVAVAAALVFAVAVTVLVFHPVSMLFHPHMAMAMGMNDAASGDTQHKDRKDEEYKCLHRRLLSEG